jgi:hypothetical protein
MSVAYPRARRVMTSSDVEKISQSPSLAPISARLVDRRISAAAEFPADVVSWVCRAIATGPAQW